MLPYFILELCFYADAITPIDAGSLKCCDQKLRGAVQEWSWTNYNKTVDVDLANKSNVAFINNYICELKQLRVRNVVQDALRGLVLHGRMLQHLMIEDRLAEKLPPLPSGLKHLDVKHCSALLRLPQLPAGLEILDCSGCRSLESLPELPGSLISLDCSGCTSLKQLPDVLPVGMKKLSCRNCLTLQRLPEMLPAALAELDVSGCSVLLELPPLPRSLVHLNCSCCYLLHLLPVLPARMVKLDCSRCPSLRKLPPIPGTLTYLALSGCKSLHQLPDLSDTQLQLLHCTACDGLSEALEQLTVLQLPPTLVPCRVLGLPQSIQQSIEARFFEEVDEMVGLSGNAADDLAAA
jgi:hypothetical protein